MPRGRMVSRSISTSRSIESMSEWAQLLFDRVVIWADDFGRLEGDPAVVKAETKPMSARPIEDFASAIAEMITIGAVTAYICGSRIYLQVNKHDEHQTGLHKRTESRYPAPATGRMLTATQYLQVALDTTPPEIPGNSLPEEKRREEKRRGTGREENPPTVPPRGDAGRTGSKVRKKAATHMTPEWRPTGEVLAQIQAECPAVDAERAIPEFRDYWIGEGKPKADWDATFRNRVRTIAEKHRAGDGGNGRQGKQPVRRRMVLIPPEPE